MKSFGWKGFEALTTKWLFSPDPKWAWSWRYIYLYAMNSVLHLTYRAYTLLLLLLLVLYCNTSFALRITSIMPSLNKLIYVYSWYLRSNHRTPQICTQSWLHKKSYYVSQAFKMSLGCAPKTQQQQIFFADGVVWFINILPLLSVLLWASLFNAEVTIPSLSTLNSLIGLVLAFAGLFLVSIIAPGVPFRTIGLP